MNKVIKDKMMGCLYGQAIGDALGLGTEFMTKEDVSKYYPSGLHHYNEIIQDAHRSRWTKGAWTDDTDMMLCILDAFEDGIIDPKKVAINFKAWFNGTPMGIGSHTYKVLCMGDYVEQSELCSKLWWELSRKTSAANGALMRTSVIGLLKDNYRETSEKVCKLTHYDSRCVGSCVIATSIINNLVWENKELSYEQIIEIANDYDDRIKEWVDVAYHSESIDDLDLDEKFSIGYTLRTLSAGLWCYFHAKDFVSGLLAVVNEGGDADTNGAISGAILGAKFGYSNMPEEYVRNLNKESEYSLLIENFINKILK